MAIVKLLLIDTDGIPRENNPADELLFGSFQVSGGGPIVTGKQIGRAHV